MSDPPRPILYTTPLSANGLKVPSLGARLAALVGHRLLPDRLPEPEAAVDWEARECGPTLTPLDRHLRGRAHLVGDAWSIADLAVGGMTTYFAAADFPFERYPAITSWYEGLGRLPACRSTLVEPWRQGAAGPGR